MEQGSQCTEAPSLDSETGRQRQAGAVPGEGWHQEGPANPPLVQGRVALDSTQEPHLLHPPSPKASHGRHCVMPCRTGADGTGKATVSRLDA